MGEKITDRPPPRRVARRELLKSLCEKRGLRQAPRALILRLSARLPRSLHSGGLPLRSRGRGLLLCQLLRPPGLDEPVDGLPRGLLLGPIQASTRRGRRHLASDRLQLFGVVLQAELLQSLRIHAAGLVHEGTELLPGLPRGLLLLLLPLLLRELCPLLLLRLDPPILRLRSIPCLLPLPRPLILLPAGLSVRSTLFLPDPAALCTLLLPPILLLLLLAGLLERPLGAPLPSLFPLAPLLMPLGRCAEPEESPPKPAATAAMLLRRRVASGAPGIVAQAAPEPELVVVGSTLLWVPEHLVRLRD
mmetsp:Transcript_114497/g.324328  ORF Transcript_114497/g.324328 Transcript_114497/m.324328 type:complete len:304 (+) Transcript_114497:956-1867(+)